MDLELEHSIPDRDVNLEKRLLDTLFERYVRSFELKIGELDCDEEFVRDDTYHGILSPNHIMYKLKVDSDGNTVIKSKDGNRGYEFLVEFDRKDPAYGIYYGCRGLIYGDNQQLQIETFVREWETVIKPYICQALNNTFPGKNFTLRCQYTDNANNKTFWPFWFALYPEESVVEVAGLATKIIRNTYRLYLDNPDCFADKGSAAKKSVRPHKDGRKKASAPLGSQFTECEYRSVCADMEKRYTKEARDNFERFIRNAVKCGVLEQDMRYERCWRFVNMKNYEIAKLLELLFYRKIELKRTEWVKKDGNQSKDSVSWDYFVGLFTFPQGKNMESVRKSLYQRNANSDNEALEKDINVLLDKLMKTR